MKKNSTMNMTVMDTKKIKNLLIGLFFVCISFYSNAQKQPSSETKTFKTSANCGDCKERIEAKLNYTKGIVFSELDVPTKMLTIKWKLKKISEAEIKQIVSNIGYDIDDIPANPINQSKLPACCQPGGHD